MISAIHQALLVTITLLALGVLAIAAIVRHAKSIKNSER